VIHAGFYYSADSLKAKFTRDGNRLLTEYCERKRIPINRCGKLVVARDETELPQLEELLRRRQSQWRCAAIHHRRRSQGHRTARQNLPACRLLSRHFDG